MQQWGPNPPFQPQQQEPVFFNAAGAFVSRSRVVLNGVTYPVNAISHVRVFHTPKPSWPLVVGIISAVIGFLAIANSGPEHGGFFMLVAVVMFVIYFKGMSEGWGIALGASGAERHAILSTDANFIRSIEQAINNALASRY